MKTGWGEGPDDGPAMPLTARLLEAREHRAGPLETALARSRQADAREARLREAEAPDADERAAGYVTRGYTPGLVSQLAGRLSDTVAELEAEQAKIEKGERASARAAREHDAGRVDAWGMIRMLDGDFGDAHRAEQLEKRAAGIRRQIAEAQDMISPPQQRDPDPLEAATRRANAAFREATRAAWEAAQSGTARPGSRPPFGSVSRGRSTEPHTGRAARFARRPASGTLPGPCGFRGRVRGDHTVNAAEAAVAAALAAAGDAVPEGLPTHADEMRETGLDVLPVADAGAS